MNVLHTDNADLSNQLVKALERDGKTIEVSLKFANLPNTSERVDFVTELLKSYKLLPKYIESKKDNTRSEELRKEANKLYVQKEDEKALEKYTYSVAYAENKSESLGLAFANRSAVLFKLKMFKECKQDIDRAYQNNYPESLKIKLQERKKNATALIQNKNEPILYHQPIPEIPTEKKNAFIECASDSVIIKSDPKHGRYIEATKDIEIGEVIAVENAAYVLLEQEKWCHCYHCLTLCYNPIACEGCVEALFCSANCKNDSAKYHKFECPILATIHSLDLNTCTALPLRILLSLEDDWNNLDRIIGEPDDVYRSGRFKELHNLVTNEEKRKLANLFERIVTVALFCNIVFNHNDFPRKEKQNKDSKFKELLFRLLQILACNFHTISELTKNSCGIYDSSKVGAGAYSFLSLFNHSCSPNVSNINYGTIKVAFAMENIKKGEQLFENYGFHYAMHSRKERKAELKKQFLFDCACVACTNNWPNFHNLPVKKLNTHYLMSNYEKLANADLKVARDLEPTFRKLLNDFVEERPCRNYCELEEMWKQCLHIFGNIRRSLN